ncbi:MAG: winged helix-turn-helix domain-containing tetratricopeptide repeat protein [Thermoanaerobaculia bacterium]
MDGWSVHQDEGVLSFEDRSVRLEPRVMDVLVYLAAEPGEVVSKEDLLEAVWEGAYVEEGVLSQAIHSLRKALGDDARQPRFIQTIPKRGYRLVASVSIESAGPVPVPETVGVAGEETTAPLPATAPSPRWMAWVLGSIALLTVLLILVFPSARINRSGKPEGAPTPVAPEGRRIVVLPFEDLNRPADLFFATGLTEEITNDLSSLAALEVISRTSARQYAGAHKPLPEIARELKVDYVLEGTVQWGRNPRGRAQARIRPRLVRAADDVQIWADQFDTRVEDIFSVQSEISRRVIGSLGITLIPKESRVLRDLPTENLEAYRAYLRGRVLKDQPSYSEEYLLKAARMFGRAVQLDPTFAAAWAELSQVHSYIAFNTDRSPERIQQARQSLEHAVLLAPNQPATRLAQIYFSYRCLEDFDSALAQLIDAAQLFPNNAEILETLGLVLRRKGRLTEAVDAFRRASKLDPRTGGLVWDLAETFRALREYEQADRAFTQALSLAPDVPFFWEQKALNQRAWTGDPEAARAILNDPLAPASPELEAVAFQLDLDERKYGQAVARLSPDWIGKLPLQDQSRLSVLAVVAQERLSNPQKALAAARKNLAELKVWTERFPREPIFRAYLAMTLAQMGRGNEALAQAEQAARQSQHDTFSGPRTVEVQAMVDTILGRRREAVARLAKLLSMSYRYSISTAELQLDPVWDPLRGDSDFKALYREFEK